MNLSGTRYDRDDVGGRTESLFFGKSPTFFNPFFDRGKRIPAKGLASDPNDPFWRNDHYRDLAVRSGFPRAVRAVGTVCARKPVAFTDPCHRVIRSDGKIGNYQAGPDRKRILLQIEKTQDK
jgi:O-6-methylguanine DNA methyltransferase